MKEARLTLLYSVGFHLHGILEKTKQINSCQGLEIEGEVAKRDKDILKEMEGFCILMLATVTLFINWCVNS